MSALSYRRALVVLVALFGSFLVLWSVLTPAFRAPDEPQHFNSVMRLATGGGWPAPGEAFVSDATLIATREAGFTRPDQPISLRTTSEIPRGILRSWGLDFTEIVPLPPEERSVLDHTADLQDDVPATVDQMSQHPPLYYAVAAGLVRAVGALEWRWDQQLLLLRLFNCLIAVSAIPIVAAIALRMTDSRAVALAAAAGVVGAPQLAHISSAVTNDTLTTTIGLALTLLAVRALTGRHSYGLLVAIGTTLGLGLLAKAFLLGAVPMVTLALLVRTPHNPRFGRRVVSVALVGLISLAVGGWWWLRNLVLFGAVQPTARGIRTVDWGEPDPVAYFSEALRRINRSFWGNFGWLEIPIPDPVTNTLGIALIGLAIASIVVRSRIRVSLAILLTFPLGALLIVLSGTWTRHVASGSMAGLQGRYLFSALGALLCAAAFAATVILARRARTMARFLPPAATAAALAFAAYGLVRAFQAFYQPWDESALEALLRWASWSPLPGAVIVLLMTTPCLLGTLALYTLWQAARAHEGSPIPSEAP